MAMCKQFVDEVRLVGETDIERAVMAYLVRSEDAGRRRRRRRPRGGAGRSRLISAGRKRRTGPVRRQHRSAHPLLGDHPRARARERIVSLRITIDDRPGVLGRISSLIGQNGANILEVSHRRMFLDVPAKGAELEIMIETRDRAHAASIVHLIEA